MVFGEEIEARADGVLSTVPTFVWDGMTLPIPVEDIVDSCFGLLVREEEDLRLAPGAPEIAPGQTLSGLLLASRGEIWVNAAEAREWPGRRRFTISHELGHWVLHRTGQESLFCRKATVSDREGIDAPPTTRPPLPITEKEANAFAAALLMPPRLVREQYARTNGDFEHLCRMFGASGAAMGRRLHAVVLQSH